jgi:Domain of unknown function (DUF5615)
VSSTCSRHTVTPLAAATAGFAFEERRDKHPVIMFRDGPTGRRAGLVGGPGRLKLLLDEMYPPALAGVLRSAGLEASTVAEQGLAGPGDLDILVYAEAETYVLLTENVADFPRLTAERLTAGMQHPGILIAPQSTQQTCSSSPHRVLRRLTEPAERPFWPAKMRQRATSCSAVRRQ